MTKEEVLALIQESDLDEAVKSTWVTRISEEGLTQDVLDDLKDAFQAKIDEGFAQLGIDISDTDEYKAMEQQMVEDVEAVQAEFDGQMAQTSKLMSDLQSQAGEVIDKIHIEEIKANLE